MILLVKLRTLFSGIRHATAATRACPR